MSDESLKISANLSRPVMATLQDLAKDHGVSISEILGRAISHEKYLSDAIRNNRKILVQDPKTGNIREVVFG